MKRGFTMVELLVVMAIMIVLASISIPTIESMTSPKHALRKEGRKIMQLMAEARQSAMARKVTVSLWVHSESGEIRMIESQAYRTMPNGETNDYEKVVALKEGFDLKAFSVAEIQHADEEEDPFWKKETLFLGEQDEPAEEMAVSFTHFGGCDGGGISLMKEGVGLDIAADILTGRPKLVKRESGNE